MRLLIGRTSSRWVDRAKMRSRQRSKFLQKASAQKLEKETSTHDRETDFRNEVTLSDDLLLKIFTLLPAESVFRAQFVCRNWFSLIKSPIFITTHTQQSETLLICRNFTILEPGFVAGEKEPKCYFHFLDYDYGNHNFIESSVVDLVDIRASCDGLILATMGKNKSLILMNPLTRKHIELPSAEVDTFFAQSFGIAFDNEAKTYKVVHLFREKSGSNSCRILNIRTGKWTRIPEGHVPEVKIRNFEQIPVSIGESLYWMHEYCYSSVSLNVRNEKFSSKKLPVTDEGRLLDIGGSLGFVTQPQQNLLEVWFLIDDNWIKQYSVSVDVAYLVPIFCSRNGKKMVLESIQNRSYVYEFETCEMKQVSPLYDDEEDDDEHWVERIRKLYIPHKNTLVSWHIDYNEF